MAVLSGKTFVSASGPGQSSNSKTVKVPPRFIPPAPVAAEVSAENQRRAAQQLLRMQTMTKSFFPPNGDLDWGRRLYEAGLGLDCCLTDGVTEGWLQAQREVEGESEPN